MKENEYLEQKNELIGENISMKKLFKKRLNEKGLTLIELLAVIVILAIIAAIAIPAIANLISTQRDKAVLADAQTIIAGAKLAVAAGDCTGTCDFEALQPYVDGIDLVSGDQVVEEDWVLTWTGFEAIEDDELNPSTDNAASEAAIIEVLE